MERPLYIASCSFGKDSIATILLALGHNEPLDAAVFAEVMFDHSRGISGEIPEHIQWIRETAKPKLEEMGVKVDIVSDKTDLIHQFDRVITKGEHAGKTYGFPIASRCSIQRDMKLRPIHAYYRQFEGRKVMQYVGIAADEPIRLARMKDNQISLLDKYGLTEADAKNKCIEYGLLSPIYSMSTRGGCWFCPNQRLGVMHDFRALHPELWHELEVLSTHPNQASPYFRFGATFEQVTGKLDAMDAQQRLF